MRDPNTEYPYMVKTKKSTMGVKWMEGPLPKCTYSLVTTNKEQGFHSLKLLVYMSPVSPIFHIVSTVNS